MKKMLILAVMAVLMAVCPAAAADRSDNMKPRWVTSALPTPKSPGYIFISSQGTGKSLEEARQMALVNLTSKLEHERGLVVSSTVRVEKTSERNSAPRKNSQFTLEASERGKQIDLVCRVVDEYWERKHGTYFVTELFTVNDSSRPGQGSYSDNIKLTTSYGAAPVFYSLIPGVGQFYKGSNVKGGLILGGTAVGAAAIIMTENQRAIYAKKMKEHPEHIDFYRNKKANWELGRNIAIGATAALYVYNLIDAAVAPGRRRVNVNKRNYSYSLVPIVYEDGVGMSFALNF
ncbi:MAG: hypothetical protein K2M83_07700 [Muribaculaceae bacterium]|nr:hypothetical protein [Muribaculaceae bacterium]